jgi:hypothetical protein
MCGKFQVRQGFTVILSREIFIGHWWCVLDICVRMDVDVFSFAHNMSIKHN